jgi:inorganic pyrophosphatase
MGLAGYACAKGAALQASSKLHQILREKDRAGEKLLRAVGITLEIVLRSLRLTVVDEELGVLKLSRILPAGHSFPFDFGSIPGTRAEDGDALDVMVLVEQPSFPGCLFQVRLIGVLTGRQTEKRKTIRNDRLLAVPETAVNKPAVRTIADVDPARLGEIQHFFVSYNLAQGRRFSFRKRG